MKYNQMPAQQGEHGTIRKLLPPVALGASVIGLGLGLGSPDVEVAPEYESAVETVEYDAPLQNEVVLDVPGVVLKEPTQQESAAAEVWHADVIGNDNLSPTEIDPVENIPSDKVLAEAGTVVDDIATIEDDQPEDTSSEQEATDQEPEIIVESEPNEVDNTSDYAIEEPDLNVEDSDSGEVIKDIDNHKGGGGPDIDQEGEEIVSDPILDILPEADPISAEMDQKLAEDTVYIAGLGCSGMLIRNDERVAIGAATAEHCGLRTENLARYSDENLNLYVERYGPLVVSSGDTIDSLVPEGTVSAMVVPKDYDYTEDVAILSFEGNDPMAVYEAFNTDARNSLQQGDTAYLSGWPLDQDHNNGNFDRQTWPMTYLGNMPLSVTSGEYFSDASIFVMKSNEDGAECSFGASGSIAVDAEGNPLGVLAAFNEFTPDTWVIDQQEGDWIRKDLEREFNVSLVGYDVFCGFVGKPHESAVEVVEVHTTDESVADSYEATNMEELVSDAFTDFYNVDVPNVYINGLIELTQSKKSGGSGEKIVVSNPFIKSDGNGNTVLYWLDDDHDWYSSGMNFAELQIDGVDAYEVLFTPNGSDSLTSELIGGVSIGAGEEAFSLTDGNGNQIINGTVSDKSDDLPLYILKVDGNNKPYYAPADGSK